jgi:chromosomal replication initiation ATPase DnaA
MSAVIEKTAVAFGVTVSSLLSPRRTLELSQARFAAMLVLRRSGFSYPAIARLTKRKDHTTVMHGVKCAAELEKSDPGYRAAVSYIAKGLLV